MQYMQFPSVDFEVILPIYPFLSKLSMPPLFPFGGFGVNPLQSLPTASYSVATYLERHCDVTPRQVVSLCLMLCTKRHSKRFSSPDFFQWYFMFVSRFPLWFGLPSPDHYFTIF